MPPARPEVDLLADGVIHRHRAAEPEVGVRDAHRIGRRPTAQFDEPLERNPSCTGEPGDRSLRRRPDADPAESPAGTSRTGSAPRRPRRSRTRRARSARSLGVSEQALEPDHLRVDATARHRAVGRGEHRAPDRVTDAGSNGGRGTVATAMSPAVRRGADGEGTATPTTSMAAAARTDTRRNRVMATPFPADRCERYAAARRHARQKRGRQLGRCR